MKKNKSMLIVTIIALAIILIGSSYAYFAVNFGDDRTAEEKNNSTSMKTCEIAEATMISNIPNSIGSFQSDNIFPGHKEVASLSVSAKGNLGSSTTFQFVYNIEENTLKDNIKVSLYKSKEPIETSENYFNCKKEIKNENGETRYQEVCEEKELGSLLSETILNETEKQFLLGKDTLVVTHDNLDKTGYYYVVIEFMSIGNQDAYQSKSLKGSIEVELTSDRTPYKEPILNGMDPVIKDELIPITIENDGVVRKASMTEDWYHYVSQEWANAIILKDESTMYCPGEIIPEDNIESYFVWIPKYRYQLWDLGNYNGLTSIDESKVHTIPLIFGDYNTKDEINGECTTPMLSGESGNCEVGDYMTHPAFISIPSTGFWVGKFETSKSNSNADNSINPDGVQIKPNEVSWRNIQVANAFYTTYDYKRNLDSHMMKNTEWGAVAYLQHSAYGSHQSVRLNNNSNYVTGYASVNEPTCGFTNDNRACNQYGTVTSVTQPYNTKVGYLASTTANISGIYDMSGGSYEYVMGVMMDTEGNALSGYTSSEHSNFNGSYATGGELTNGLKFPEEKYYDKYIYGEDVVDFFQRILGDAIGEVGPFQLVKSGTIIRRIGSWYSNIEQTLLTQGGIWYIRGITFNEGNGAGLFAFSSAYGSSQSHCTYRVILTPTL